LLRCGALDARRESEPKGLGLGGCIQTDRPDLVFRDASIVTLLTRWTRGRVD
jgi:hypothetical protein